VLKEAFTWNSAAFNALKQALVTGPTLQLSDLEATFIVNCDTSSTSFGAVLHQDGGPIAFYSHPITPQHNWPPARGSSLGKSKRCAIGGHTFGHALCGVDKQLHTEVSAKSAHLHHSLACVGEQAIWL
jgi:hypothetical protein